MRIGIAADHGGFEMKVYLTTALKAAGYEVVDFGAHELVTGDDYPDFVVPLASALASGEAENNFYMLRRSGPENDRSLLGGIRDEFARTYSHCQGAGRQ